MLSMKFWSFQQKIQTFNFMKINFGFRIQNFEFKISKICINFRGFCRGLGKLIFAILILIIFPLERKRKMINFYSNWLPEKLIIILDFFIISAIKFKQKVRIHSKYFLTNLFTSELSRLLLIMEGIKILFSSNNWTSWSLKSSSISEQSN